RTGGRWLLLRSPRFGEGERTDDDSCLRDERRGSSHPPRRTTQTPWRKHPRLQDGQMGLWHRVRGGLRGYREGTGWLARRHAELLPVGCRSLRNRFDPSADSFGPTHAIPPDDTGAERDTRRTEDAPAVDTPP